MDGAGTRRSVRLRAMPDYLAIGSDSDFVRMPMRPETAQAFCDAFGLALPSPKLVNETWKRAAARVWPQPLVDAREDPATFLRHSRIVDEQLGGNTGLAAGMKKDVVLSARMQAHPGRVAIFGWHKPTGEPIQPLSLVHGSSYVDYSHGVRPLMRLIAIDGRSMLYEDALRDPVVGPLLSDEGPIAQPRYPALEWR